MWYCRGDLMRAHPGFPLLGPLVWLAFAPSPGLAQDFQVNTYTLFDQFGPDVTRIANGEFVVVWSSFGSPGSDPDHSIQGRRFDATGSPLADQFQVNTYTTGFQMFPYADVDDDGNFVVVWQDFAQEGDRGLYGQRFAAGGSPLGGEFQVNTYTTGNQRRHSVAMTPDGDFVVVWHSDGSSGSDNWASSVLGQRFAATGLPVGSEFQVNSYTAFEQSWPAVAVAEDGEFIVVWQSNGSDGTDGSGTSIQGQRFSANGLRLGGEFQVNSYTWADQIHPSVALTPDGGFVVAWESYGSAGIDTLSTSIQARRFADGGSPLGPDFEVNTYVSGAQSYPRIDTDGAGSFVVVWHTDGFDG